MPLAFESASHGTIAFGFFNIKTDMLVLDDLFFFADRFCAAVVTMAKTGGSGSTSSIPAWTIADRLAIGDLHGAIAGSDLSGFIGTTYAMWPFPRSIEAFKQDPDGAVTQARVEEMIAPFSERLELVVGCDETTGEVSVGELRFTDPQFAALVAYVDRGGYPRWRGEVRPAYVVEMIEALERARSRWWKISP